MRKLLTYTVLYLLPCVIAGQGLRFEYITMEDGLSSHRGLTTQNSIIQDEEGFIWIASFNGLNRLDGQQIKVFSFEPGNPKSLGDNIIASLCQADDGKIWAGGGDTDIYIFDPQTETFETLEQSSEDPESFYGKGINVLAKDQDGNIWICTRFNGVSRWNKDTEKIDQFNAYFGSAKTFFQQRNGDIWIGSFDGLRRKIRGEDHFVRIENLPECTGGDLAPVHHICELPDGDLLISSGLDKVWRLDPQTYIYLLFTGLQTEFKNAPNFFLSGQKNQIWTTGFNGIQRYDPSSDQLTPYLSQSGDPGSGSSFELMYSYQDRSGSLWIMTTGGGIQLTHSLDNPVEFIRKKAGYIFLSLSDSLMLLASNGIDIINIYTKESVDIGLPEEIKQMNPTEITLHEELLWIAEWNGAVQKMRSFNLETKEFKNIPFKAGASFVADRKGHVWTGLNYFDPESNTWIDFSPEIQEKLPDFADENMRIHDLFFDQENKFWIATNNGIYSYQFETGNAQRYHFSARDPGSLNSNLIFTIFPGDKGRFYATSPNGLNIYDPQTDVFNTYSSHTGLLHDNPTFVVEDKDENPWIGSSLGLQKLDTKEGKFINYSQADGLYGKEMGIHFPAIDYLGNIYFSQSSNQLRFHPDSLKKDTFSASVYLMDFFVNREKVNLDSTTEGLLSRKLRFMEKLHLPHNNSDFGFSFIMPVFKKSKQVEYFYQLYPYEKEWINSGNRTEAHYTNIPSGQYQFKVKARTHAGVWSLNEASIKILVATPWWRQWWAYTIYFMLGCLLLYGLRHYELGRQYEKSEALRLQQLDSLKTRLYTNITHEFRTPLTVIMGLTNTINGHEKQKRLISRNSKNLLRLINQLLDLSKLDSGTMKMDIVQGDIINYLQYLTDSFHSMAEEKGINLSFHSERSEQIMDYDEVKMQHIIYNLLSNAIKFTKAEGEVILAVQTIHIKNKKLLVVKVKDTGLGISAVDLVHIFDRFYQVDSPNSRKGEGTGIGLALTKEMIELMGAIYP